MRADYRKLIRRIGQQAEALRSDCEGLWDDNGHDCETTEELAELVTESFNDLLALSAELAKYAPHAGNLSTVGALANG